MNNLRQVVFRGSVNIGVIILFTSTSQKVLCFNHIKRIPNCNHQYTSVSNMSQKSITSFFKITPKINGELKSQEQKEALSVTDSPSHNESAEESPGSNKVVKKCAKRQRLASSGSDSPASPVQGQDSPPPTDKKKAKRQRIISSSSEADSPQKEENKLQVKIEKTDIKTYNSPKSKKNKVKPKPASPAGSDREGGPESPKQVKSPPQSKKKIKKEKPTPPAKEKENNKTPDSKKQIANMFVVKNDSKQESVSNGGSAPVAQEEYNPGKAKYDPVSDACWLAGQEVPYLALSRTLEQIEGTRARLRIVEILANYLRSVIALTPEDLLPSVYLCLNQLAPAYHSLELGIAETYLMKAIGQCSGRSLSSLRADAASCADLGLLAERARSTQRLLRAPPPLTVRRVLHSLQDIARLTGHDSVNKKISKIQTLYVACRHSEARYLIRSLEGKLRIGLAEQSVLQALAVAATLTPPTTAGDGDVADTRTLSPEQLKTRIDENALLIKTTYCECPNYERVIPALLQHGVAQLPQHCRLTPGVPLKPMLAHPTKGLTEVFDRFESAQFTCEWKYDGERAQIHVPEEGGRAACARAAVFSRNQEDNTTKYPDVVRRLPALLADTVTSCVIDAEAVAYDVVNKRILPFQVLSTRKRKDALESDIKVQVCVYMFDLLYLNGRALVRETLLERRRLLRENFNQVPGEWEFATSRDCSTSEEVQQFLEESVRGSCEGLMIKMLTGDNAKYDIARRSHNWLKLKKDYLEGVGDSIDVVVVGAYRGRGKRSGTYGGFLVACYDPDSEEYQTLCKLGTGFSDNDLATLTERLQQHVIPAPRSYYRFDASHAPDVWFSCALVWEVRCADLSLSPAHRAAQGRLQPGKGISLRFPRFVRERDDKSPEQATSALQLVSMYLAQDQVRAQQRAPDTADDYY